LQLIYRIRGLYYENVLPVKQKNHTVMITFIKTTILNILIPLLIQQPTIDQQLEDWSNEIQNILNIVTGLFAIVGGFLIFFQYMQGNDQAQKNFIKFVIGLAIFGLVNLIASFFLP